MKEGHRQYLQSIIDARPEGVHGLFAAYGITAEPTPEAIQTAYGIFGKPFIGDMVNMIMPVVDMPAYDSAEGDTANAQLNANASQAEQKKTLWENIAGVLNGTANVLTGWGVAFGKGGATATQTPIVVQQPEQKSNTALFLGLGLLAVIIMVAIIIMNRKK